MMARTIYSITHIFKTRWLGYEPVEQNNWLPFKSSKCPCFEFTSNISWWLQYLPLQLKAPMNFWCGLKLLESLALNKKVCGFLLVYLRNITSNSSKDILFSSPLTAPCQILLWKASDRAMQVGSQIQIHCVVRNAQAPTSTQMVVGAYTQENHPPTWNQMADFDSVDPELQTADQCCCIMYPQNMSWTPHLIFIQTGLDRWPSTQSPVLLAVSSNFSHSCLGACSWWFPLGFSWRNVGSL